MAKTITATNKATGEVIELPASNYGEVILAWQTAQQYAKAADELKDKLKKLVPEFISERGTSEPLNGFQFRSSNVQRRNYDKATMREFLDPDVFDVLVKPDKGAVDKYLKENLETLGPISTKLRETMVDEGRPYQVIKLERVDRDA